MGPRDAAQKSNRRPACDIIRSESGVIGMDLSQAREKLDTLDAKIASLFVERMDVIKEIAAFKAGNGVPVLDPVREQQVISRLTALTGGKYAEELESLYQGIFEISRSLQNKRGA